MYVPNMYLHQYIHVYMKVHYYVFVDGLILTLLSAR